jgi:aspartyl-tRNA(Asn)/glutamyl-tRNA(Gln) amidotransferase subunit B
VADKASVLDQYPDYETNIGIEVHVQLNTKSKIFCECPNKVINKPNVNICQICSGYPGVLPILNRKVVEHAILAGLATESQITMRTTFARKHYFYPDLPKNYQITQHNDPICSEGRIKIKTKDGKDKYIRLTRIHMEEDAGKNIHAPQANASFVNLNRTGTPLLEVVTYPDISNAFEAKEYLKKLRSIVQYLHICSGNMEEGAFRADTNISVRKKGATKLGTRCELKNVNSFKYISDAIEYEIERQIGIVEDGGKVSQQTLLWDAKNKKTAPMRSKEEAADYRYFEDPDLPILDISEEWIKRARNKLPELPDQKIERFTTKAGLSEYEATILVDDLELANYFDEATTFTKSKSLINWILRNLIGYLKEHKIELNSCKVTPKRLAKLVELIEDGTINNKVAQEVFEMIATDGADPEVIIEEKGLKQIGSTEELEAIVVEIVGNNPKEVAGYKGGKDRLFGFFVGQAMKKTQGKGNPKIIQELLKKHLG